MLKHGSNTLSWFPRLHNLHFPFYTAELSLQPLNRIASLKLFSHYSKNNLKGYKDVYESYDTVSHLPNFTLLCSWQPHLLVEGLLGDRVEDSYLSKSCWTLLISQMADGWGREELGSPGQSPQECHSFQGRLLIGCFLGVPDSLRGCASAEGPGSNPQNPIRMERWSLGMWWTWGTSLKVWFGPSAQAHHVWVVCSHHLVFCVIWM